MNKEINNIDKIQNDLTESLCSSKLKDLSVDVSELTIDSLMDDGLLKQIPVVKTILAIVETTRAILNGEASSEPCPQAHCQDP